MRAWNYYHRGESGYEAMHPTASMEVLKRCIIENNKRGYCPICPHFNERKNKWSLESTHVSVVEPNIYAEAETLELAIAKFSKQLLTK